MSSRPLIRLVCGLQRSAGLRLRPSSCSTIGIRSDGGAERRGVGAGEAGEADGICARPEASSQGWLRPCSAVATPHGSCPPTFPDLACNLVALFDAACLTSKTANAQELEGYVCCYHSFLDQSTQPCQHRREILGSPLGGGPDGDDAKAGCQSEGKARSETRLRVGLQSWGKRS
ncbi:hypothetical protein B0T16DRAFT_163940 [Cercophora newfieldiana]|uniref:Uncharacterized protein n=1 Tax=Cercophora newfieldiana TaxID=92897 RepID=A0AA40CPQ3_9PEZI|nr:hypothetical protein B0T16DRAFT_163940 [Cercophora newfieldiana]